tara:strand:- start:63 stop:242 length:180 start_codon:yes stop_codon:yes gene_type:complete
MKGNIVDKYKSSFFNNCIEWFFTDEEREPMGFIATFFLIIVVSIAVNLAMMPIIYYLIP